MSLIGSKVVVQSCTDPTKLGLSGRIVLETANMLLLDTGDRRVMLEKKGTVLVSGREVITGEEIRGRLEDRLRSRA
jgi:RNase P/RNase MRP subunit p29